jgi:hypothetical protein
MTTAILKNNFHDTETTIRVPAGLDPAQAWGALRDDVSRVKSGVAPKHWRDPPRVYRRVCNALCGSDDCTCGIVR